MQLRAGSLLHSTDALSDDYFAGATLLITEYNAAGAVGFILNRPFGRTLNELEAFRHCPPVPLYEGGPVDGEHLYFIHKRPDLVAGGTAIGNGIYFGGDFAQAVNALNTQQLAGDTLRIFVGYCGWDTGDLEAEIAEGSWVAGEGAVL